jgi:hypothetical protein
LEALRTWYRAALVQPVVVALMLLQVASGVTLLWRVTAVPGDLYRTLQTSTGALLSVFIVSHLNAVFILGRAVSKADTTFLWASGAPAGLLPDPWNVRLVPHYSGRCAAPVRSTGETSAPREPPVPGRSERISLMTKS